MIKFDDNNQVISEETPRALLAGVSLGEDISYSMEELKGLAEAAGAEVLGTMVQTVKAVTASTYMGSGKLEELAEMCRNMEADMVIFNDELSGMQLRNIEEAVGVKVVDRTILILDIFAARAMSGEAKLQVELAQLQYRMPRLLGFGKSLSRLGGGIGTRGPGEKKLETDRRHIQRRADEIKREIEALKKNRGVQRSRRESSGIPVVALAGYTNAGKSSIMNRLLSMGEKEDKQVFEKDMLFATLDTSQRLIRLEDGRSFILVDTVGFVDRLPHALVDAFRSTLEESVMADLILHVIDSCFEDKDFHIGVTEKVLEELGAGDKPIIKVFNKIDACGRPDTVGYGKNCVCVSARTGEGMDELLGAICGEIFSDIRVCELLVPYGRGDVTAKILENNEPEALEYREDGTYIKVGLTAADRGRFSEWLSDTSR